ncbi:MAG: hypothetical protein V4480_04895 [Patescibacteria group bacterium]
MTSVHIAILLAIGIVAVVLIGIALRRILFFMRGYTHAYRTQHPDLWIEIRRGWRKGWYRRGTGCPEGWERTDFSHDTRSAREQAAEFRSDRERFYGQPVEGAS